MYFCFVRVNVNDSSVSVVTTPNGAGNGCHGIGVKQETTCTLCPCGVMKLKQEQLVQAVAKK